MGLLRRKYSLTDKEKDAVAARSVVVVLSQCVDDLQIVIKRIRKLTKKSSVLDALGDDKDEAVTMIASIENIIDTHGEKKAH